MTEQVALHKIATLRRQNVELSLVFHSLGNHSFSKTMAHGDNCASEFLRAFRLVDLIYETAIDLDGLHRIAAQVAQR